MFTERHERIETFRETGTLKHIYKKELDQPCFFHDTAYSDSKDLTRTNISSKNLKDKAYKTAINPKYDGYKKKD